MERSIRDRVFLGLLLAGSSRKETMMTCLILFAMSAITLWLVSLWRILSSSSSSVQDNPSFLSNSKRAGNGGRKSNVLLVVAHPDDESMFFAPTILYLTSNGHNLHILCISNGNAEGKGNARKEELYRACAILKVPPQQIKIVDHMDLQDGFDKPWKHQLLATFVEEEIKKQCIDVISTNIIRKYIGPVDIWISILSSLSGQRGNICLSNQHPLKSYQAMAAHYSQWVWFRKLFVLLSRYTYVNTLRRIIY